LLALVVFLVFVFRDDVLRPTGASHRSPRATPWESQHQNM
jgi:hypothetical protein